MYKYIREYVNGRMQNNYYNRYIRQIYDKQMIAEVLFFFLLFLFFIFPKPYRHKQRIKSKKGAIVKIITNNNLVLHFIFSYIVITIIIFVCVFLNKFILTF